MIHAAVAILAGQLVVTVASIPDVDVSPTCRSAARITPERMQSCMKDEQNAREQLEKGWSRYSVSDTTNCVATAKLGTFSYVELLTCLEMATSARAKP